NAFQSRNHAAEKVLADSHAAAQARFAADNRGEEVAFAVKDRNSEAAERRRHRYSEGSLRQFDGILVQFAEMIESMRRSQQQHDKTSEAENRNRLREEAARDAIRRAELIAADVQDERLDAMV